MRKINWLMSYTGGLYYGGVGGGVMALDSHRALRERVLTFKKKSTPYMNMYDEMQSCNARNYLQLFAYAFFVQYSSQILCKIVLMKHSDLQRTRFIDMDFSLFPLVF